MKTAPVDPFELAARQFERTGAALYYNDPVGFARDCIRGLNLTDYQTEMLAAVPVKRRVAARGPHGLGKTTTNAVIVLWFAFTRDAQGVDWKIVTTAGAWRQLERYLWPEIHKWATRLDPDKLGRSEPDTRSELLRLILKLRTGEAFAAAASDPKKIEGAHADSLLYIFDESKAIIPATFDAAEGAFSGAKPRGLPEAFAIATSTPGEPAGRFYDIQTRKPGYEDWWVRHVTLADCIAAGRVSQEWADQRRLQWGEGSALYHNRVLGEFYSSDEDAVVPLSWVEAANERWQSWVDAGRPQQYGQRVLGVDVARGGADLTALAVRTGPVVSEIHKYRVSDTMKVVSHVIAHRTHQADLAVVDVVGVGAGVVDRLRQMQKPVIGFSAAKATRRLDRSGELGFANLRSLMWWTMREMLDPAFEPTLALPVDPELLGDLTAPHWRILPGNKIAVESKADVAKRLGRSTDLADAVGHTLMTHSDFDERPGQQIVYGWNSGPGAIAGAEDKVDWADGPITDGGFDVEVPDPADLLDTADFEDVMGTNDWGLS